MKDKVLVLASVASMIDQFNMPNIELLQTLDYEVHVACNFEKGSTCSQEKITELKNKLKKMNVNIYQVDFTRSVFNLKQDIIAYSQVKKIMIDNKYKFIHCHSPIGGVIGRLASKATKTKCIYTAHGFHFYKGAPLKNWILFYPIEKWLSRYTNVLITINKEDYERAKKKLKAKHIEYVPGIGIDLKKFQSDLLSRESYRNELGLADGDIMLLSVGELNLNKNHQIVVNALSKLQKSYVHYFIAGEGNQKDNLLRLAREKGVEDRIHLLGFRKDVTELYKASDIFIHPSLREGLSVALMEAMASGLPVIASQIRGNLDLLDKEGGYIFELNNIDALVSIINILLVDLEAKNNYCAIYNKEKIKEFDINKVNIMMKNVYLQINNNMK